MGSEQRLKTDYVGREFSFTTPPDEDGWQVTYDLAVQAEEYVADGAPVGRPGEDVALTRGDELVLIGIHIRSLLAEGERTLRGSMRTIPAGGLTAQRARELIRPGAAMTEFLRAAAEDKIQGPIAPAEIEKMLTAHKAGTTWRAQPTPEFVEFVRWIRTLPALRELVRRGPFTRRQRLALTAAAYVRACIDGHPAPRRRVAEAQGRDEAAVRDDLHAARHEDPPLLTGAGLGKRGGTLTPAARRILEQVQQQRSARTQKAQSKKGGTT